MPHSNVVWCKVLKSCHSYCLSRNKRVQDQQRRLWVPLPGRPSDQQIFTQVHLCLSGPHDAGQRHEKMCSRQVSIAKYSVFGRTKISFDRHLLFSKQNILLPVNLYAFFYFEQLRLHQQRPSALKWVQLVIHKNHRRRHQNLLVLLLPVYNLPPPNPPKSALNIHHLPRQVKYMSIRVNRSTMC